ncbi:hypothetical protein Taro_005238 [Colocasia esculenta]|uniref:Uncharacterized protein n=1 Tax=Colocasia esculenta TaxID=4460 RepID=A0A843TTZ9_COLES|nr:hypothetical protein [Colocasia esculenta]
MMMILSVTHDVQAYVLEPYFDALTHGTGHRQNSKNPISFVPIYTTSWTPVRSTAKVRKELDGTSPNEAEKGAPVGALGEELRVRTPIKEACS